MFALQYSGCYVIMLEKVSQNTMACTQRRRWCFSDAHHQPMEKLNTVRFSPQKKLNKLITPLRQEIPLKQRCEADADPRVLDSPQDISGCSYKMSQSKRQSL